MKKKTKDGGSQVSGSNYLCDLKVDGVHADINMGCFFRKILVREIAGILQWDATKDISQILDDAENKLNHHLKKKIGVNPSLILPGNYARPKK